MGATMLYDRIGTNYSSYRRPDPRIAALIAQALGPSRSVLNVGAGTGSYEPIDRNVVAVEISRTMIDQRRTGAPLAVQASAMNLPFADDAFDAAMAVLTVHHWADLECGLREMRRVSAGPCVILTWEPPPTPFWLTEDYLPEIVEEDLKLFPPWFRGDDKQCVITPVPVPADCSDGFLGAYWRRPEMYLDPGARRAISSFGRGHDFSVGLERLRRDLADGGWHRRRGYLMGLDELDLGYRLVVLS